MSRGHKRSGARRSVVLVAAAILTMRAGGVAAQQGAAPAPAEPAPSDLRVAASAPARTFRPVTSGFLQFQYQAVARQGQDGLAESGVALRRARVALDADLFSGWVWFRAELSADLGVLAPLDIYAEARPRRHYTVRVGQMRVPFSASWMVPDQTLLFPERSIATEAYRYDYDLGVLVTAYRVDQRLVAMFGGFNGAGKNVAGNDNIDPVLLLRVAGTPLGAPPEPGEADLARTARPSLTLGASGTIDYVPVPGAYGFTSGSPIPPNPIIVKDADMNGRTDGVRVWQLASDVDFRWRGFAAQGEAYLRHEVWFETPGAQPPTARFIPKQQFSGAVGQVSYRLPRVPLVAGGRYSYTLESPLALQGRLPAPASCVASDGTPFPCALPYADRRSELSFAVAYFARGPNARLSVVYSNLRWHSSLNDPLPAARDQRFILQTQVGF